MSTLNLLEYLGELNNTHHLQGSWGGAQWASAASTFSGLNTTHNQHSNADVHYHGPPGGPPPSQRWHMAWSCIITIYISHNIAQVLVLVSATNWRTRASLSMAHHNPLSPGVGTVHALINTSTSPVIHDNLTNLVHPAKALMSPDQNGCHTRRESQWRSWPDAAHLFTESLRPGF